MFDSEKPFSAETLKDIIFSAVPFDGENYSSPEKQANRTNIPVSSEEELWEDVKLNSYHLITGIRVKPDKVPYTLNVCSRKAKISEPDLTFETPIFGETLDELGHYLSIKFSGKAYPRAILKVITLPEKLIEKYGWKKGIFTNEKFVIVPGQIQISYLVRNILTFS
jgi:hypothetical protein